MKRENLIFMYGEDSFSLLNELKRWKDAFVEKHGDFNLQEISGEEIEVDALRSTVTSLPMLGEKRLIILKDALSKAELKDAIADIPDFTVLVIAETAPPDKRTSFFKYLSTNATLRLFLQPKGAQLKAWILRRAALHGGLIDDSAAAYLAEVAGENLWALDNELQKLALFARGGQINIETIDELVSGNVQESIFKMTDELAQKNTPAVLKLLRQLEEQGEEPGYIFAMIARQFRIMLEIKSLLDNRYTPQMIATRMKVHPFVANTAARQCRNFTHAELKKTLAALFEIDRKLKTGKLSDYLLAIEKTLLQF
ncbi:DNA polymerase III subunit delta [Candidatus Peregrinibacteria bacterium]|nr:DNA polymerase III subunit delta [Candidatus Peregrinibacteria bacterium]